jgi:putative restriction endonuclease
MELRGTLDLFRLAPGDCESKRSLFDLQHSKVAGSSFWRGEAPKVGNTPQQESTGLGPYRHVEPSS